MDEIILVDKPAGVSSFFVVSVIRGMLVRVVRGEGINDTLRSSGDKVTEGDLVPSGGVKRGDAREAVVRAVQSEVERIGERMRAEYEGKGEAVPKRIKVGHAGTLDPFATGLLIILIGKGTKRAGEFLKLDKEYIAELKLGEVSSTGDPEGEIIPYNGRVPGREEVERVVAEFLGESEQTVPVYSAVKINGERAYKLARRGKEVEMPRRKIHIYNIKVLEYEYPRLKIQCEVSSGTYIRALGEDIGKRLGVGAYLTGLRRTKIGKYRL